MKNDVTKITYTDEVMADKTVCRRYSDGRTEWRSRLDRLRVAWRDDRFDEGVDELLGDGILKRTHANGHSEYGREQGFGRTAWQEGRVLTVNETSLARPWITASGLSIRLSKDTEACAQVRP